MQNGVKEKLDFLKVAVDQDFFDDACDLFMETYSGHVGKYIYDDKNCDNITKNSLDYYIPQADEDLIKLASEDLKRELPEGVPYVDFGVGGIESIRRHALPIMKSLQSSE